MSGRATMIDRAKEYLAYRRALGFALDSSGALLLQFARFADHSTHRGPLTADYVPSVMREVGLAQQRHAAPTAHA